ncbi:DUF5819 family protein [Streptomyces sp. NPDC002889]|uniref:DUF5819 family protein n=1 Tax=Streptomyces sp. NPDC002889 TaxID=3364669 RepID=UPI0036885BCD
MVQTYCREPRRQRRPEVRADEVGSGCAQEAQEKQMRAVRMGRAGCGRVPGGVEPADEKELSQGPVDGATAAGTVPAVRASDGESAHQGLAGLPGPLGTVMAGAVALCLAASLVHVLLVFLHVAPPNRISQTYDKQIKAWIYPLFEQNWKLFAPNPESVNRQISARTKRTSADGNVQVSNWFDLTAVDTSAIKHSAFPSHTEQNMLRRAWTAYLELHGSDDQPRSERATMMQKYLRNIAVDRVTSHRHTTFEAIQLRVITRPVAAPATAGSPHPTATDPAHTRYLPWWKVESHGD